MEYVDPKWFRQAWQAWYPEASPLAYELRDAYSDRWLRIHTLPDSSREPNTPAKLREVLTRLNQFATTIIGAGNRYVLLAYDYEGGYTCPKNHPLAELLRYPAAPLLRIAPEDEQSEATSIFGAADLWTPGSLDQVLTLVARDELRAMLLNFTDGAAFAPYDGGADAIFPTWHKQQTARQKYAAWLSPHPEGL